MKRTTRKAVIVMLLMIVASVNVSAQGIMGAIKGIANTVTETSGTAVDAGKSEENKIDSILLSPMNYQVKKITVFNEAGDSLNADGTVRYSYRIVDEKNKIYDPGVVEQIVNQRSKAYKRIFTKIGFTAGTSAVINILSGNIDKILNDLIISVASGVVISIPEMIEIVKINKSLKQLREVLKVYKRTFTDEGLPKDAKADLTDVKGIDFTKCAEISKPMAEVLAELEASKNMEIPNLDDLDIEVTKKK